MDRKENKYVGICHKLFDFVMKSFALQAFKKATLGTTNDKTRHETPRGSGTSVESKTENSVSSKRPNSSSLRSLLQKERAKDGNKDEKAVSEESASAQAKAPKKMVSINDRVEEIHKIMKKRKKSLSFDKLNSFADNNGEDDPNKPLRSILKAPSNLDEKKIDTLANQNGQ